MIVTKTLAVTAASVVTLTLVVVAEVGVKLGDVGTCRCSIPGIWRAVGFVTTADVEAEEAVAFTGATMGVYSVVVQLSVDDMIDVLVYTGWVYVAETVTAGRTGGTIVA